MAKAVPSIDEQPRHGRTVAQEGQRASDDGSSPARPCTARTTSAAMAKEAVDEGASRPCPWPTAAPGATQKRDDRSPNGQNGPATINRRRRDSSRPKRCPPLWRGRPRTQERSGHVSGQPLRQKRTGNATIACPRGQVGLATMTLAGPAEEYPARRQERQRMAPRTRVRGCRCRSSSCDGTATPSRRLTRATPPLRDDVAIKMLIGIFLIKNNNQL